MSGDSARFMSIERLLEHGHSLRRLALDLARDEAGAEDLLQETWMVALRRDPPARAEPGPWLRGVLRNVFRAARRGESRRQRREALASRREAAHDPGAGLIERAEILRRVVGHVLDLEPIYREAILLRYFEDLSSAEVAERLGVPMNTVHTRVRRGIEKVRRSLDAEHGGERRAWALVLLPAVPHPPRGTPEDTAGAGALSRSEGAWTGAAVGLGGIAMSMKTVISAAAIAVALLGLGATALLRERTPSPSVSLPVAASATTQGGAPSLETGSSLDTAGRKAIESLGRSPARGADLVARVRGPGGEPVPGAALEVVRFGVDRRTLGRKEAHAARGASDADGDFHFQGLEPGTYEVRALSPDHRPGRSEEVDLDETHSVEVEIELAAGLAMEGIVLDPAGAPVAGAVVTTSETQVWVGKNFAINMSEGNEPEWAAGELSTVTDTQGRFRLSRLPSGNRQLLVRHPDWAPAERGPIAAGSRGIELRLERGAIVQGRVRDDAGGCVDGLIVRAFIRNHHAIPEVLRARFESKADASGAFRLEKVPREPLRIQVPLADGRTETLDIDLPGRGDVTGVEIVLQASGTVRGRAVSSAGDGVPGAAVIVDELTELGRVIEAVSLEDGSFEVSGVNTGVHCNLTVLSPGRPKHVTRFRSAVETDLGDLVIEEGLTVSGVVVSDMGAPIPRSRVWIGGFHGESFHSTEIARRTDASGRVSFDGLLPGTYSLHAEAKGYRPGRSAPFKLETVDETPEPRVVLDEGEPPVGMIPMGAGHRKRKASLEGQVRDSERGHPVPEFQVFVGNEKARARGKGLVFLDPEGRFVIDELDHGERAVRIFASGYIAHETRISLEPGEAATVLAGLERGATISGRLTDPSAQPVPGARVFSVSDEEARGHRAQGTTTAYVRAPDGLMAALSFDVGLPDEARSAEDGTFLLEGVRPGRTLLRIDHPRFSKRILDPFEAPPQGSISLGDVRLDSGSVVEGIVLGEEGRPVRGGTVHIQPMGDDGPVETYLYVPIAVDGTYRKEGLEPGRAWIRVYGMDATGREVELEDGSTLRADFRLPPVE